MYHSERGPLERQSRAYYERYYPEFRYQGITDSQFGSEEGIATVYPRANNTYYWPVHYVLPLLTNENAIELDANDDAIRAISVNTTVQGYQPTLSAGVRLVQERDPHAMGLILRHPGIEPTKEEEEEEEGNGGSMFFSQIVLRVPDVLKRASGGTVTPESIFLYDGTNRSLDDPECFGWYSRCD